MLMLTEKFINFAVAYNHMEQIVFRRVISSAGRDKYGDQRYTINVPKSIRDKVSKIAGKEVIVIVILPDDEE
jgi:hypothetical protein